MNFQSLLIFELQLVQNKRNFMWRKLLLPLKKNLCSILLAFEYTINFPFTGSTAIVIIFIISASTSQQPVGSKSLKIMKQKGGNSNENSGGSLLRQQLQGSLCSNKYRKAQETLCKECGKPIRAKCLLKNCRKSDEVLCPDCGRELTVKCLLKSCSN